MRRFFLNRLDFKQNKVFRFFLDCSDEEAWKQRHLERLKNPLLHESFHSLEHVLEHYRKADIGPLEGEYVIDSANPIDECFAAISRIIAAASLDRHNQSPTVLDWVKNGV